MRFLIGLLSLLSSLSLALPLALQESLAIAASPAASRILRQSPMVIGNGLGYAVLSVDGTITKLYAHPYRFERPNPDESKDGYDTANFLKALNWSGVSKSSSPLISYIDQSHVLAVKDQGAEYRYFMPFTLKRNVLIASGNSILSSSQVGNESASNFSNIARKELKFSLSPQWLHEIEKDQSKEISGRSVQILQFKGVKEALAIVPLSKDAEATNSSFLKGSSWAFLVLENASQADAALSDLLAWQGELSVDALIDREIKSLEEWRVKPTVTFRSENEKKLWRQNETFLRMSQIQEPNTEKRYSHGLILASLPDGVWFTPWVRDMAYAVVALVKMGHLDEAKEGLLAYFNARPTGKWKHETRGLDYQISVTRYFGDGSEEADYSGLQTPNVEFDDWGLALWAVSEYFDKTQDLNFLKTPTYRGSVYESMRDFVVKPLFGNLDKYEDGLIVTADSSLWEEHQQNKKHFAFSTFSCIRGLQGFLKMAEAMKDEKEVALLKEKLALLEKGFKSAFIRDGVIWGTAIEPSFKNEIDGSLLEAFNMDIVSDPAVRAKTMEKMELLKTASGGYKRLRGSSNYEKQEFVYVNFNYARVLQKMGKQAEAQQIIDRMVEKSMQDRGLIAECYVSEKSPDFQGEIGDPTGSIPMIGYGSGVYVMTLVEREAK